jgi:hypothetical protein
VQNVTAPRFHFGRLGEADILVKMKIAVLPGDGIGKEVTAQAVKALRALNLPLELETARWARRALKNLRRCGSTRDAGTCATRRCDSSGRYRRSRG